MGILQWLFVCLHLAHHKIHGKACGRKENKWNARIFSIMKVGGFGRTKDRGSGVSLQKQAPNLNAGLAKQGEAAVDHSRTMLLLLHLCLQNGGPAPLLPLHAIASLAPCMCIWLAELSQMTIPEAKETEKWGGLAFYLRKTDSHHGGPSRCKSVKRFG